MDPNLMYNPGTMQGPQHGGAMYDPQNIGSGRAMDLLMQWAATQAPSPYQTHQDEGGTGGADSLGLSAFGPGGEISQFAQSFRSPNENTAALAAVPPPGSDSGQGMPTAASYGAGLGGGGLLDKILGGGGSSGGGAGGEEEEEGGGLLGGAGGILSLISAI